MHSISLPSPSLSHPTIFPFPLHNCSGGDSLEIHLSTRRVLPSTHSCLFPYLPLIPPLRLLVPYVPELTLHNLLTPPPHPAVSRIPPVMQTDNLGRLVPPDPRTRSKQANRSTPRPAKPVGVVHAELVGTKGNDRGSGEAEKEVNIVLSSSSVKRPTQSVSAVNENREAVKNDHAEHIKGTSGDEKSKKKLWRRGHRGE